MKKISILVAALCATTVAATAATKTVILDGSATGVPAGKDATTEVSTISQNGFSYTMSAGGKQYTASGNNKFDGTTQCILIGKKGAYIYNNEAFGDKITKFEVYVNKSAAGSDKTNCKLSISFGTVQITAAAENAQIITIAGDSDKDKVYDLTVPDDAKYFYYTITTAHNSQVAFRITYEVPTIVATGIMLDKESLELEQYKSATLMATLVPEDATTDVVWTTDDEAVATVVNGKVMAMGIGMAKIIATITPAEGMSYADTCVVTVKEATVITCAQAVEIAKTVSADSEIAAGGKYVIHGYVTELEGTPSEDMEKFGNYSVWLADEKDGGKVFEAYQVKPLDEGKIANVGDLVEIVGDITQYKGTYGTVGKGAATIKIIETTAIRTLEVLTNVYAHNGRIYAEEGTQIYTITGLNVTAQNQKSTLGEGIYIVKANNKVAKIVVK